jgi:hypothetical protein
MNSLSQEQLLIIVRALSSYLLDQVQNEDTLNAEKTARLLHEATHNLKG